MNIEYPMINRSKKAALRGLAVLALAAGFFAHAQSTDDSNTTDFSSFQLIVQRNIFDPNRYPSRGYVRPRERGVPTFFLAGTMSYRKGMFAFFSGTSEEDQKALQEGGTIEGYTVTKIDFDGVQMNGSGKIIRMKVGASMRQEGDGWELIEPAAWGETAGGEVQAASQDQEQDTNQAPQASLPSGNEGNSVLKRLMEQREQELK
jgi:hypothetical protein